MSDNLQSEVFQELPKKRFKKPDYQTIILHAEIGASFRAEIHFWITENDDTHTLICTMRPYTPPSRFPAGACLDTRSKKIHWQQPIDIAILSQIDKLLEKVEIKTRPDSIMGLDGTIYDMELPFHGGGMKFSWWQEPPKGWEPLEEIIKLLNRHAALPNIYL